MIKPRVWMCIAAFILSASNALAAELTETFATRARLQSQTAIWNQALGVVHPTLHVMNYKAGFTPLDVPIGDGSHGVFDITTYAQFSAGGDISGNVIRLDLNVYPVLMVTSFHLAPGWRLEPIGDRELVIYSLSDVNIEGEIWCHGNPGTNAIGATPGIGGSGRCGGRDGGDGGAPGQPGTSGDDAETGFVTGGAGGNFTGGAAVGGGAGGSWNTTSAPGNGPGATGAGGLAGSSSSDPEFLKLFGGAGGGGGSGTPAVAGAGGGAGGGVVIIHAARDFLLGTSPSSATGLINVNGGDGGDANTIGGPGGGGGGGSIQVFVGRAIEIFSTEALGASQASGGAGGTNTVPAGGANGAPGRSWFSSVTYNLTGTGFYTPSEELPVVPGNVEFSSSAQSVVSTVFDLESTLTSFTLPTLTPASSDFLIELRGSTDNFISDDSGWTTDMSALTKKRYVQFRATITASDVNSPTFLDAVTINYTASIQDNFQFVSSGCGRVGGDHSSPWGYVSFVFVFLVWLKFKTQNQRRITSNSAVRAIEQQECFDFHS